MTAQRPNAVVYQEYATLTVTPDIPDLNVLIVGPAKQLLDYLDDKTDCYADDYGTYHENCPFTPPVAVTISSPPNIVAGGIVDPDSVSLYLDVAEVSIVAPPSTIGQYCGIYTTGDNLFEAHSATAGQHFGTAEVVVGDTAIVVNAATNDYVMTVKELCYTLHDHTNVLDFQDAINPVQPGDILTLTLDTTPSPNSRDGVYIVKRVLSKYILEVVSANWVGSYVVDNCMATISITSSIGTPRTTGSGIAVPLADFCNLRMTGDFASTANFGNARKWRIERHVTDILLADTDFTLTNNSIMVHGAITVDLGAAPLVGLSVTYGKIYVEYAAFRTDLQSMTTFSSYLEIETELGKYDARNPLMVGAVVAKANTSTPIKVYGVPEDTLPEYLEFLDRISTERDVYAIVPLTYTTSIISAIKSNCENLADPDYAIQNGTKQKFRVVIGALELQTTDVITNARGGCTASQQTVTAPADIRKFTLSTTTGTGTFSDFFTGLGLLPGDILHIHQKLPLLDYYLTVAQTNDSLILEADEDSPWVAAFTLDVVTDDYIEFTRGTTVLYTQAVALVTYPNIVITAAALDNLYLVLTCPTATFLTSGVIPGDMLEMPENPTTNVWTGTNRAWEIDEVISNQKLRIMNTGSNTSDVESELPHGGRRTDGTEILTSMYARIYRDMDKSQQVDAMVVVAQSFSSKRTLLCFPDQVEVTSLVDGSLPRTTSTSPEAAGIQPGYYLSCAVGGQTAGQPPQQGFTYLGISGIDQIYNTSDYFSELQLTELSNGGVYVFVQENPVALPYSIHEVTTDVSALEFYEYMTIKDFDFVAWTFLDTLLPFIGRWNVTPETIEFIRQALFTTGNNLKARRVAKIGAPLTDYLLNSVAVSPLSPDRIDAYMQVTLPMTLNTIALHLVA